jgi:lysophospholipase L1-like esterase
MAFGDSLTWGAVPVPHVVPTTRHPAEDRWPRLLEAALAPHLELVEEGLGGRTTNVDDPLDPRLNGARVLPVLLASHTPLDLVVLLLGTNDLKAYFDRQPFDIAVGVLELVGAVRAAGSQVGTTYPAPDVLVVAPPPLSEIPDPWHQRLFAGAGPKSAALAGALADVASSAGVMFFDSGTTTRTSGSDGIHLTAADNANLAQGVAEHLSVSWEPLRRRLR